MAEKGGQPGNQNAANGADNAPFKSALRRAIAQDEGKRIRQVAETLLNKAADGEPWAVKELIDRTDGKAAQALTLANAPGEEFKISKLVREIVRTPNQDG